MFTPTEEEILELSTPQFSATVTISSFNVRLYVNRYSIKTSQTHEDLFKAMWSYLRTLRKLADERKMTKIITKVRAEHVVPVWSRLEKSGFVREACIPGFFHDGQEAWVLSCFADKKRQSRCKEVEDQEKRNLKLATEVRNAEPVLEQQSSSRPVRSLPEGYTTEYLTTFSTAKELGKFYSGVFSSYPYPINDAKFLLDCTHLNPETQTMSIHRVVRGTNGKIVAAVGADVDMKEKNAEVTDFATLPSERGKGLASFLIDAIEQDLVNHLQVRDYFAVVRAASLPMMKTFVHKNYKFGGTLVNNSRIGSNLPEIVSKDGKEKGDISTMYIFSKAKQSPNQRLTVR